jgi:hypothetical protein
MPGAISDAPEGPDPPDLVCKVAIFFQLCWGLLFFALWRVFRQQDRGSKSITPNVKAQTRLHRRMAEKKINLFLMLTEINNKYSNF